MTARATGRHRGASEGGRTVGLLLLTANVAGLALAGLQVQQARAAAPVAVEQPDHPQAGLDRPDVHTDRWGTRPPVP